ncbi:MAG: DedA family protein [Thermoleophilales bacterium]|nr:DedA family protein [Thermoleophilales bacterium]
MTPESAGIPIPSEATMLFAGFNVDQGRYSLAAAVAVGTIANLVGSWILYAAGYFGRQEVLAQHGSKFHITPEKLDQADRWFDKWGVWAVFFSRMLPIVRTFISLPAGVARMPFWKFSVATLAGCLPWVLMLTLVGREVGANWVDWKDRLHYVDYAIVAAIAIAGVYFVARRRRSGNEQENKTKPAPEIS